MPLFCFNIAGTEWWFYWTYYQICVRLLFQRRLIYSIISSFRTWMNKRGYIGYAAFAFIAALHNLFFNKAVSWAVHALPLKTPSALPNKNMPFYSVETYLSELYCTLSLLACYVCNFTHSRLLASQFRQTKCNAGISNITVPTEYYDVLYHWWSV